MKKLTILFVLFTTILTAQKISYSENLGFITIESEYVIESVSFRKKCNVEKLEFEPFHIVKVDSKTFIVHIGSIHINTQEIVLFHKNEEITVIEFNL